MLDTEILLLYYTCIYSKYIIYELFSAQIFFLIISFQMTSISFRAFTITTAEGKCNINYIFFRPASAPIPSLPSQTICKNEKLLKTTTVTGKNLSICRKEAPVCLILCTFCTQLLMLKWLFGWKKVY